MDQRRRFDQLAFASLNAKNCPASDLLAGYLLGLLSAQTQLEVAAHVRGCPLCQHDLSSARPPAPRPRVVVARLLPTLPAMGRRSLQERPHIRQYIASDLLVELTMTPAAGESWRMTGQLLRAGVPVAEHGVALRAGRRRYQVDTDGAGFFTFEVLPPGRYTLSVIDGPIQLQIRNLRLSFEEA